jgi:hypothetical protein
MKLFKLKSLEGDGLLHVLDMLIHDRIYLTTYHPMNDIEEGNWCYGSEFNMEYQNASKPVRSIVEKLRFTSFVESVNNPLMWAHYAGGFSGVALEYELDPTVLDIRKIEYIGEPKVSLEELGQIVDGNILPQDVGILRSKAPCWDYEDEWRLYGNSADHYLNNIKPQALIFGIRDFCTEYDVIKKIAGKFEIKMGYLTPANTDEADYKIGYV